MRKLKEFFLINFGLLLVAAGIYFFKVPNKFVTGGVSGLAIIMNNFFPGLSVGPIMMIINLILVAVGFAAVGPGFGSRTIYSSFVLSGMVWIFEKVYPMAGPFTNDAMLELVFSILLPAVGSAILFNQNASTGGTDIVAKILSKVTSMNIGRALLMADFAITLAAGMVFGIRIWMYSVLGLIMKGFIIDLVIDGLNICKQVVIISSKPGIIEDYITNQLKRGATIYKAEGAFTRESKEVISVVVNRRQAIKLRKFIREIDEKAFITISNTSEIIGRGFRDIDS